MSRWRPPAKQPSPYITAAGYAKLERELGKLWKKRRVVNDALAAAAAEGDRSENAEYIYRKKEQAGIDRRIRYLQKRLPDLQIIDRVGNQQQVFFGARVGLKQQDGGKRVIRIVGADETDTRAGDISIDSPLARALLKKAVGDEISLEIAEKITNYRILSIAYN